MQTFGFKNSNKKSINILIFFFKKSMFFLIFGKWFSFVIVYLFTIIFCVFTPYRLRGRVINYKEKNRKTIHGRFFNTQVFMIVYFVDIGNL